MNKKVLNHNRYVHTEYEITYDPIPNPNFRRLPNKIRDEITELHDQSILDSKNAIPKLEMLIKKYPNLDILYNFLSSAYNNINDVEKAERIVFENYTRNPNYLFAKINYAQLCLENGDLKQIPKIFDHKYDLQILYPNRQKFHISEYVGFAAVMSEYFFTIGEIKTSNIYYKMLNQIARKHPLTKRLRKIRTYLVISGLFYFFKRIIRFKKKGVTSA